MGSESPRALQTAPATEGAELRDGQLLSVDRFEIYVPREADVRFVPAQSLPPGLLKRMGLLSLCGGSDAGSVTLTWISPVVVREKGPTPPLSCSSSATAQAFFSAAVESCSSTPRGQGLCWLPVTCCNLAAFKVLRKFLPEGRCQSPDAKYRTRQAACAPPPGRTLRFSQDAMVIHRDRIFLSIRKVGPRKKRVEHRRDFTPEAPLTLCQQTAPGMPGTTPQHARHSCDPSAAPLPKKVPPVVGLEALRLQFGVERQARVTLADLPDSIQKTLSAVGHIDLEKHPDGAQLCRKGEQQKLGPFGRSCSTGSSRKSCAEDPTETRCSADRKKGVAHYGGNIMKEVESDEPVSKMARRGSAGGCSTSGTEVGDHSTDEGKSRDLNTGEAKSGNLGELSAGKAVGGDFTTGETEGELSAGEDEGVDVQSTCDGYDLCFGEGDDLCAEGAGGVEQNGGEGAESADEDHSGMGFLGLEESYLAVPSLGYTAGFDFDQSARDEKISRIRARLSEKEAALQQLARLPL